MEHETLFTATKWDILKILEGGAKSPIEITKELNSSMANVSQQLRLLEMAGLVTSKRVSNRDKDKPRLLYSLVGNLSYVISTSDNFVDKKIVPMSEHNKIILHIWFLEDPQLRYALEKAFWQIESQFSSLNSLCYAGIEQGIPVLEYSGSAKLPASVSVQGNFHQVKLRATKSPKGHMLYAKN